MGKKKNKLPTEDDPYKKIRMTGYIAPSTYKKAIEVMAELGLSSESEVLSCALTSYINVNHVKRVVS